MVDGTNRTHLIRACTNYLGVGLKLQHYRSVNARAELCDSAPFEQWSEVDNKAMQQRLLGLIARRRASMDDARY